MISKKRVKRYITYIIGILLISISFNMIFLPNNYFSYGALSVAIIPKDFINPIVMIILINTVLFLLCYMLLNNRQIEESYLTIFVLPVAIYLTSFIPNIFLGMDKYLALLTGSIMCGYGYGLIYKNNLLIDGFDIFELAISKIYKKNHKLIIRIFNGCLILICLYQFGFEKALFSFLIYYVILFLSNKVYLGISDCKTFFIITDKDKEIKKAIMDNLNENLTSIDVEGGYSKEKKKLIVSVINTREYYMLRELVRSIDSEAFITIIDSYQVINGKKITPKSKQN